MNLFEFGRRVFNKVNNVLLNANRGKKIDMIKYKLIKNEDIVLRDIHQNFFLI